MADLLAQTLASPAVTAVAAAAGILAVALWLAAAWWTYRDAARRTESSTAGFISAGWILLSTPVLLPIALAMYQLVRPQVAAAELREQRLVSELAGLATARFRCAECDAPADPAWLRCPSCSNWLAAPCAACGRWSDRALEICPWCGSEQRDRATVRTSGPGSEVEPDQAQDAGRGTAAAAARAA